MPESMVESELVALEDSMMQLDNFSSYQTMKANVENSQEVLVLETPSHPEGHIEWMTSIIYDASKIETSTNLLLLSQQAGTAYHDTTHTTAQLHDIS